jgi:hypothetical protein
MDSNHTIGLSEMMVMKLLLNIAAIFVSVFLLGSGPVLSQTASTLSRNSIQHEKRTRIARLTPFSQGISRGGQQSIDIYEKDAARKSGEQCREQLETNKIKRGLRIDLM